MNLMDTIADSILDAGIMIGRTGNPKTKGYRKSLKGFREEVRYRLNKKVEMIVKARIKNTEGVRG